MKEIFEFINDWRDTIYYSMSLVMGLLIFIFVPESHSLKIINEIINFVFLREIMRWWFWIFSDMIYKFKGVGNPKSSMLDSVCCLIGSCLNLITIKWSLSITYDLVPIFLNVFLAVTSYLRVGGFQNALSIYWKELFDYPRKQKPPKKRWESFLKKMEDLKEKFQPDFVPSPARIINQ